MSRMKEAQSFKLLHSQIAKLHVFGFVCVTLIKCEKDMFKNNACPLGKRDCTLDDDYSLEINGTIANNGSRQDRRGGHKEWDNSQITRENLQQEGLFFYRHFVETVLNAGFVHLLGRQTVLLLFQNARHETPHGRRDLLLFYLPSHDFFFFLFFQCVFFCAPLRVVAG